jgi:glucans biosynthesis protein C
MALAQLAPATRQRDAAVTHAPARLAYIDNLRALVIAMVIVHHAAQPYGPTGGNWPIANPTRAAILEPFFIVNAAFGLGLLFLIAGYFMPRAYDRKGARRFLADRLLRLGLPLLFVSLVLFLPLGYAMGDQSQPFGAYLAGYLRRPELGHMWFVSALIIFIGGYALWRRLTGPATPPLPTTPPDHPAILGYVLVLALVSFVVRIWFPIDHWVDPVPFVRLEPAHLPQYLSLFIIGIVAERRDWLRQLPTATGMAWLAAGLAAAVLIYAATILGQLTAIDIDLGADGRLSLVALVSSTLESVIAVGLSVGLLTLFREHGDYQGVLARELAATSYAVYIIHIFPVIGLQVALTESALPPLAKFGLVALLALPLCFGLAYGLRKLPGVRRVV